MNLPTILSGPILRRVDPSQVYIWIATKEHFSLAASLYEIKLNQDFNEYNPLKVRSKAKTIQLGEHLFIHLVKTTPSTGTFPVEQLLGYNVHFTKNKNKYDLNSFQMLSADNPNSIVYEDLRYPTFFINTKKETTTLYGSCRKLHGKGHDILAEADNMLSKTNKDLTIRPSSLCMLGDQIYADDVADPIFPFIQEMGHRLIGSNAEDLSLVEPKLQTHNFQERLQKIQGRKFIVEQLCHFTSSHAHNHLLTFGEYAVMYLLSWNPSLWQVALEERLLKTYVELYKNNRIHFIFPISSKTEHQEEYLRNKERFTEQIGDLINFHRSIPKVRRLLANIPTYMIFDDHDITDDWNISLQWKKQVENAPLGKHTIANGLAAYWVFQGWGNTPDSFDATFITNMQQYFSEYNIRATSYQNWVHTLFDYQSWHFVAPTAPKTLFLDTRTLRDYDTTPKRVKILSFIEETWNTPKLIGNKGWELIDKTLRDSGWCKGESLMIASPTPLYGIDVVESFLKNNIYPFRVMGVPVHYKLDFEAWKYNLTGFYYFLSQLKKWQPSECIILSGDVHYASTVIADVEIGGERLSIYQLTSSPMKNMSFDGLFGSLFKLIVWMGTLRRKENTTNLYYEEHGRITKKASTSQKENYLWKEKISYQSMEHGTIVETKNNFGVLVRANEFVQSILLKDFDEGSQDGKFPSLSLSNHREESEPN